MKNILWSGRSHNFTNFELNFLKKIIKEANPATQGKFLKLFEKSLENYLKVKNVFAVSSAAAALEIISILLNIKKGDEIIIPAHTYCVSAIPFIRNGAKIIWADIDFNTRVINFDDAKKKITKKTIAIVCVHLYGYAVNIPKLKRKINNKKIKIIEDCAQAMGAEVQNKKVGTMGDFACFSFHGQKNISTLGEGGAIRVKNSTLSKKVLGLRHNGHANFKKKRKHYWIPAMGNLDIDQPGFLPFKFTLTEVQCAAGYLLIRRLDKLNKIRIKRAKKFILAMDKFKELNFNKSFGNNRHVYHLLSAFFKPSKYFNRNNLIDILYNKYKIQCVVQYYPLYKYSLFKKVMKKGKICENTEKFYNNMISFPFHVYMNEKEFSYMIKKVKETIIFLRKKKNNIKF